MIYVNADVHAEMDEMDNILPEDRSDASNTDTLDHPSMVDEKPVMKKRLMVTAEQRRAFDEIFSIEFDVAWRTASKNLHRYRIKGEKKFTIALPAASGSQQTIVSRIVLD